MAQPLPFTENKPYAVAIQGENRLLRKIYLFCL